MATIPTPTTTLAPVTITTTLDATVHRESWETTYGQDPVGDVPAYLANAAGHVERLRELPGVTSDGVTFVLVASEERTTPDQRQLGFVTVRLVLDVRLEAPEVAEWRRRWGLRAVESFGPYLAGALTELRPMREEVAGTVTLVPGTSGRLLGQDTLGGRRS